MTAPAITRRCLLDGLAPLQYAAYQAQEIPLALALYAAHEWAYRQETTDITLERVALFLAQLSRVSLHPRFQEGVAIAAALAGVPAPGVRMIEGER